MRRWAALDDDRESRLSVHVSAAENIEKLDPPLGQRPDDLPDVLALLAIAAPGVCALRALSRVAGGAAALNDAEIRDHAHTIANGLRSLFNKPEMVALLRSGDPESYWRGVLAHSLDGCLQSVLDEYAHMLVESEGLQDADGHRRARKLAETMTDALSIRAVSNTVESVRVDGDTIHLDDHRMSSHFAARYGRTLADDQAAIRESTVRTAHNSPFRPFVLASTSVGQEGLDFHTYSHAIVHWNLPGNPIDLEQREGRVHRFKGHAVRKNVAGEYAAAALDSAYDDPWTALFDAAMRDRGSGESDIVPFWVFTRPGGAAIERYVPALPLSRETQHYGRLLRTVAAYRLLLGQPRQADLLRYIGPGDDDMSWLTIDLGPGAS